jgi:hypothetical protein
MKINRILIFMVALLAMSFTSHRSHASNFIDKSVFSQLDFKSQIKFINNARKMAIQIEHIQQTQKYNFDVKKQRKVRRLQTYMRVLLETFIQSAHAQQMKLSGKEGLCLFAGWLSVVSTSYTSSTGRKIVKCTNPRNLTKSSLAKLKKSGKYPKATLDIIQKTIDDHENADSSLRGLNARLNGKGQETLASAKNSVICAPHLYGYDKKGAPFTMLHKKDDSYYNASMVCSSLVEREYPDQEGKHTNYLNIIKKNFKSTGEISSIFDTFKVFYDVCACKGQNGLINKRYSELMFQQRTCYSWLKESHLLLDTFKSSTACHELEAKATEDGEFHKFFKWLNKADDHVSKIIDPNNKLNKYLERMIKNEDFANEVQSMDKYEVTGGLQQNEIAWKKYMNGQLADHKKECDAGFFVPDVDPVDPKDEIAISITAKKDPNATTETEETFLLTEVKLGDDIIKSPYDDYEIKWFHIVDGKEIEVPGKDKVVVSRKPTATKIKVVVTKGDLTQTQTLEVSPLADKAEKLVIIAKEESSTDKDETFILEKIVFDKKEIKEPLKNGYTVNWIHIVPKDSSTEELESGKTAKVTVDKYSEVTKIKVTVTKTDDKITKEQILDVSAINISNDKFDITAKKDSTTETEVIFLLTEITVGDKVITAPFKDKGYEISWSHTIPEDEKKVEETDDSDGTINETQKDDNTNDDTDADVNDATGGDSNDKEKKKEIIMVPIDVAGTDKVTVSKKSIATKVKVTVTRVGSDLDPVTKELDVEALGSDSDDTDKPAGSNNNPAVINPQGFRPVGFGGSQGYRGIR